MVNWFKTNSMGLILVLITAKSSISKQLLLWQTRVLGFIQSNSGAVNNSNK